VPTPPSGRVENGGVRLPLVPGVLLAGPPAIAQSAGNLVVLSEPLIPEEPTRPVPATAEGPSRGRILLIDDEPGIRRSISPYLTRTGWQADPADSGAEGLRLLAEGDYAVVLCDLRMPGMSGHEFYRRLQAMQQVPSSECGGGTGSAPTL
jgi:Response regulator receiver domain